MAGGASSSSLSDVLVNDTVTLLKIRGDSPALREIATRDTTGWITAHALFEISTLPALGSCGSVVRTTTSPAGTDSKVGNVARASLMTS